MKIKHWAYIGAALIGVNVSLLKAARAAELMHGAPFSPFAGIFRVSFTGFWYKRRPEIPAPVTVRLFASQKIQSIWVKNPKGFSLTDRSVKGDLFIALKDGKLVVDHQSLHELIAKEVVLRPLDDGAFELKIRGAHKWTRGELRLRASKGQILVINRVGLEDYVSGILEGELGSLKLSPEVLKAQIVVARSYALTMRRERHTGEGYEFCDSPHCQVYSGAPLNNPAYEAAIRPVRGEYLSYKGRPIAAFYHHNCGGMTSAVQDVWPSPRLPYLVAVQEPAGNICRTFKSEWRLSLSRKSLAMCFRRVGWLSNQDALDSLRVIKADHSGRAQQIVMQGRNPKWIAVGRFRNVVNRYYGGEILKTAMFTVTLEGDSYIFEGRGWGHGVGFCQEGAIWMSRHAKTYQQILEHYFPHTKLAKLR